MEHTRLSRKGQVIIPKSLRAKHDWPVGTVFEIEDLGDRIILKAIRRFPASKMEDVAGCLAYDGPAKTLEQQEDAIIREAKKSARS